MRFNFYANKIFCELFLERIHHIVCYKIANIKYQTKTLLVEPQRKMKKESMSLQRFMWNSPNICAYGKKWKYTFFHAIFTPLKLSFSFCFLPTKTNEQWRIMMKWVVWTPDLWALLLCLETKQPQIMNILLRWKSQHWKWSIPLFNVPIIFFSIIIIREKTLKININFSWMVSKPLTYHFKRLGIQKWKIKDPFRKWTNTLSRQLIKEYTLIS